MKARVSAWVRRFALWLLEWDDACPTCKAPWAEHRCPYAVTPMSAKRECDICHRPLPVAATRTSAGKWRCAMHKAVHVPLD